jgi:hypothetical protein
MKGTRQTILSGVQRLKVKFNDIGLIVWRFRSQGVPGIGMIVAVVVLDARWNQMAPSLFSWKSPSKSGDERIIRVGKKMKSKSEKFSYANFRWEPIKKQEPVSGPLISSLQSGLKLLMREKDSVGFDNCIIWLKSENLEIWTPSTGKYQIIDPSDVKMIRMIHEENILLVACSKNAEYQFKASNAPKLEQLRLLLKLSTAEKSIRSSSAEPLDHSNFERSSIVSCPGSISQEETGENFERLNSQSGYRNSGRILSLRSPSLKSPASSKERIGARLRLRSRVSILTPRDSLSEEPNQSVIFHETSAKVSPKRLREDENDRALSNAKKIRPESKKMKAEDDIIIGNETVTL